MIFYHGRLFGSSLFPCFSRRDIDHDGHRDLGPFSGQLLGIAWILNVVAGMPKLYGIMMAAIVVTLYFSSGGLKSAAVVNIIELAVILVGFIVAAPYALNYVGGWNGLETKIAANLGNTAKTASYFPGTGWEIQRSWAISLC